MIKKILRKFHLLKDPTKKTITLTNGSISSIDLNEIAFDKEMESSAIKSEKCIMCLIVKNPVNGKTIESRKVVPREMVTKILDIHTNGGLSDMQMYNMVSKFFEDKK